MWSKVATPSTDCTTDDIYIGCAHIDLSTLTFGLPQISGWYNITDFGGLIQGQMKVCGVHCIVTTTHTHIYILRSYNIRALFCIYIYPLQVSIVPSQRLSFPSGVSSCPLPCSHVSVSACRDERYSMPIILMTLQVVLPTPFTSSQLATDPALELLPHSSDCDHIKPAPSFMDKTSSVLFKKLRYTSFLNLHYVPYSVLL